MTDFLGCLMADTDVLAVKIDEIPFYEFNIGCD
jgi:hypothetical protein